MDFELDARAESFRTTIREFVDREIRPVAHDWEQSGRYPTEIIATMKQLGLFGMMIPEAYGGGEAFDLISFSIVFEEISRAWMGIAGILGSHSLACWMNFLDTALRTRKRRYLPELATGARRTGIGLTEPTAGSDLQGIQMRAVRDGGDYVVNGTKTWITNARHANPLPVLVKTDPTTQPAHKGMSILLVEADVPGYTVSRDLGKLGYNGVESCEIFFQDVRVPEANLLGGIEGRGLQQALSALEIGRINIASRAVGVAQEAFAQALDYAKVRRPSASRSPNFRQSSSNWPIWQRRLTPPGSLLGGQHQKPTRGRVLTWSPEWRSYSHLKLPSTRHSNQCESTVLMDIPQSSTSSVCTVMPR